MSNKMIKPLSVAVGVAFVGSLAVSEAAGAAGFSLSDLDQGYQLVGEGHDHDKKKDGTCGEGKCGEGKCGEGKCGEGKCGVDKLDTDKNGSISQAEFTASGHTAEQFAKLDADGDGEITQAEFDAAHKGGEGKCGAHKGGEGKCGEGKCGEGKCGGSL